MNVTDFGAIPDANVAWGSPTITWTGTDNATKIQAAIDAYLTGTDDTLYFPPGRYLCSRGLMVGKAGGFVHASVKGGGMNYRGYFSNAPCLFFTSADTPAISFQGGRGCDWDGVSLYGPGIAWGYSQGLGNYAGALVDDTVSANWSDPSILAVSPNSNGRYTPAAGFAIDPYSGVVPTPAYKGTYGMPLSSDMSFRNIWVGGFDTALVTQPSGADGNGDFIKIDRALIEYCRYGVSISQTQSRNVSVRNTSFNQIHTALTNNKHGKQIGFFGGVIDNCSFGKGIQILDIGSTAYSGPMKFLSCYAEAMYILGYIGGGNSVVERSVIFDSLSADFTLRLSRPIPQYLLTGFLSTIPVLFNGGIYDLRGSTLAPSTARNIILYNTTVRL